MKTRRVLSLVLAVIMLISFASFAAFADEGERITLIDVDNSTTVGQAVNRLVSMGIINGYDDGTYRPNNSITRAEFCVVMVKFLAMQDYLNPEALTGFEDLDSDENYKWARPYVAMAVQRSIIKGFEDKTFRAADPVTYEQAVKMIVCALGYEQEAQFPTVEGDWSSGYIAKALRLGITKGTSISAKSKPATRGTVAILVSNAIDAEANDIKTENGNILVDGNQQGAVLGFTEVKGIVTGTYITELENQKSTVPRNHIMIEEDIYEIGFSNDPNEFMGCEVKATIKENKDGDYPIAVGLNPTNRTDVIEIEAGLIGDYDGTTLEYQLKRDGNWKEAKIAEDYITIFNNKYVESYDIAKLSKELESGNVVLVDNNGDRRYDVVKVNSYEVFVVASKSSSTQKITLMYDAEYEGSSTIKFPEDSTSLVFSLTRNGKEIKFNDISKWDVLNIKASPEEAEGRRYYQVIVTRQTVSGSITESDDDNRIVIGGEDYYIADSYINYNGEDKVELNAGDYAQVYLDENRKVVAAAKTTSGMNSEEAYAYLLGIRQDSDKSEYDLEFWLYTTAGKELMIGSADKINIDGTKYKATDKDILDYFEHSAEVANSHYADATNVNYKQPVIYQTNSDGRVINIHTVLSQENSDISVVMNSKDDEYFIEAGERTYKSSSKSFTDFKVSSSTKIIFVPDNRGNTDDYLTYRSYSSAFANGRAYYVEAYGLTSSKTAALVLMYKQNDSNIYTSSSPWMIVASKSETKDGTVIKGYNGTSTSLKTVTVDDEDGPSISAIGKGDIIRYLVNSSNKLVDYQIWFDASDPRQLDPCSDIDDAIDTRILEIHSTSTEPRKNYPNAAFRLQFGTVSEIVLNGDKGFEEEEYITVVPTIVEDNMEMVYDGDGVVSRTIGSSVKVFSFDATARNSDVLTDVDLAEIVDYNNYGQDATRVITYSYGGALRMIYIVTVE